MVSRVFWNITSFLVLFLASLAFPVFAEEDVALDESNILNEVQAPVVVNTEETLEEIKQRAVTEIIRLHSYEIKLSKKKDLSEREKDDLLDIVANGASERARTLALHIVAWLPAEISFESIIFLVDDPSALVRKTMLQTLLVIARGYSANQYAKAVSAAETLLKDKEPTVSCQSMKLYWLLSPTKARKSAEALREDLDPLRYACFAKYVDWPIQKVMVLRAEPKIADDLTVRHQNSEQEVVERLESNKLEMGLENKKSNPSFLLKGIDSGGKSMFVATAAMVGLFSGGIFSMSLVKPRNILLFRPGSTLHSHEEPSALIGAISAVSSAAILGLGAYGLGFLKEEMELSAAISTIFAGGAGAAIGLGGSMALNADSSMTGMALSFGLLGGFGLGATSAFLAPQQKHDLLLTLNMSLQIGVASLLASLTALPVGIPLLFNGAHRLDFSLGMGLLGGGLAAMMSYSISPWLKINTGRLISSSAAAMTATSLALITGYTFVAVSTVARERFVSGAALGVGVIASIAGYLLIPESWAQSLSFGAPKSLKQEDVSESSSFEVPKEHQSHQQLQAMYQQKKKVEFLAPQLWSRSLTVRPNEKNTIFYGIDLLRLRF